MRNAGVDLFRCLMMLLIVLHHVIVHTHFSSCAVLKPVLAFSNMGVVGFLVLSGWYGVHLSARKVCSIAGQIIGYGLFFSLLSLPLSRYHVIQSPILSVGNAWYGVAYLALLCISPILNAGIETLHDQGKGRPALFVIFALLGIDWASRTIGLGFSVSGFGSHSFGTFVCVYCIVQLIRTEYAPEDFFMGFWKIALIVCTICGMSLIWKDYLSYNNPILVVMTIVIFLRFLDMKLCPMFHSVICFIVPSVFSIYLIHDSHIVGKTLMIRLPFEWLRGHACQWILFPGMILMVYLVCIVLDVCVRRLPLKGLKMFCEIIRNPKGTT